MSEEIKISRKTVEEKLEHEGLSKKEIKAELYPQITDSQWNELWNTPVEEGGLGLKGKRPKKKFKLIVTDTVDDTPLEDSTKEDSPEDDSSEDDFKVARMQSREYPEV